jgi:hypothetical protein
MNFFHLGGRAFHSRSLPPTQQGCAALHKTFAGERHTKKASLLQRSRHPIRVPSTLALAQAPPTRKAHRAPTRTSTPFTFFFLSGRIPRKRENCFRGEQCQGLALALVLGDSAEIALGLELKAEQTAGMGSVRSPILSTHASGQIRL